MTKEEIVKELINIQDELWGNYFEKMSAIDEAIDKLIEKIEDE